MSPTYHKKENILSSLLREHSPEGIALLTSEPAKLMRGTILVLAGLLLAGLAWSFIGRADVIVVAQGSVSPGTREHRIYVPVKGDVSDIYAAEGMPTTKGDVLFRINSPAAIQLLGDAITAQMAVESKQKQIEEFPAKKRAAETELEAMRLKLESDREQHEKRVAESISKLAEEQKLKLEKARADVQKAQEQRDHALRTLRQHERLFNSTGGGGISKQQVEEKRKEYRDKVLDLKLSEVKLGEFELSLNKEYEKRKAEIEKKSQELLALQSKYDSARINLTNQERSLRNELRLTQAKARIASRVKFDDIDEDNYLRIRAPIDGVITQLTVDKVGEKVDDKKPIAVVAPGSGNKYLDIKIDEKNRAFLKVGMNAKIKINAFPYQRYGFLEGELEYIAPTTQFDPVSKKSIYKARISLERDYFTVNGVQIPLRYGMQGKTEIAVRKRKLIDLAIDPLRSVAG